MDTGISKRGRGGGNRRLGDLGFTVDSRGVTESDPLPKLLSLDKIRPIHLRVLD